MAVHYLEIILAKDKPNKALEHFGLLQMQTSGDRCEEAYIFFLKTNTW